MTYPAKSAANRRTWRQPETRAKRCAGISAGLTGREMSWAQRASIAAGQRARWARIKAARA